MRSKEFKNNLYLEDYSNKDSIDIPTLIQSKKTKEIENTPKPSINLKPEVNSKGEKVVVFSINIPIKNKKNLLKIDILINDNMYKDIGKHFVE
jgi:hypothetical protein